MKAILSIGILSLLAVGIIMFFIRTDREEPLETMIAEGEVTMVAQSAWAFAIETDSGGEFSFPFNIERTEGTSLPKPFPEIETTSVMLLGDAPGNVSDLEQGQRVRVEYVVVKEGEIDVLVPLTIAILESARTSGLQFVSREYGFSVEYPRDLEPDTDFDPIYLFGNEWNIYAEEGTGEPVVRFRLPESNEIMSAEVRFGVSSEAGQVASCVEAPSGFETETEEINGITFTAFGGSDAGAGHFGTTKSYRMMRTDTCYAIDLLTYGSRPELYEDPPETPFSEEEAIERLMPIVESFTLEA